MTLHIVLRAVSSCVDESQVPSLAASFLLLGLPRRAGAAADDFSAAFVSTAAMVHCSRKPYISRSCLWWAMSSCSSDSRSLWMTSASVARPDVIRSKILLRAWAERKEVYLDCLNSSESGSRNRRSVAPEPRELARRAGAGVSAASSDVSLVQGSRGREEMGAHFSRNCNESKMWLRVRASGFSATASTMGLRTPLTTALSVSDSGSFSQSTSAPSASGVGMAAGSLM